MLNQETLERIDSLILQKDGAIKYNSMLTSNPNWTDEQCLKCAEEGHAKAIAQLKQAFERDRNGGGHWHNQTPCWNDRIPYCRNLPTLAMLEEALA